MVGTVGVDPDDHGEILVVVLHPMFRHDRDRYLRAAGERDRGRPDDHPGEAAHASFADHDHLGVLGPVQEDLDR